MPTVTLALPSCHLNVESKEQLLLKYICNSGTLHYLVVVFIALCYKLVVSGLAPDGPFCPSLQAVYNQTCVVPQSANTRVGAHSRKL